MDYRRLLLTWLMWLGIFGFHIVDSHRVSFFGASHISMPLQEAKLSTNVRLRFRTHQEHAMLLLAAGRTDFCLLNLYEGRLQFRYRVNGTLIKMWSPDGRMYNDRDWHDVFIQRYENNVTMQIDEHSVQKVLPARSLAELNVHFGVLVGGPGDFTADYLSNVENLRGCISDVYYNNINVLKRAKEGTLHVSTEGVEWNCSAEFDADERTAISFVQGAAHVVLAKPPVHSGESWSLEFRTIEPLTTLLYNSGPDFVGLEIVDQRVRLLVGKGSNVVELIATETDVSDGRWHNATITYGPVAVELHVDAVPQRAEFANGSSQIIELGEEYLVGGINGYRKQRRRALERKLKAVDSSFRGCIRNLAVDRQPVGFPHFKITQGVAVGCVWQYPCLGGGARGPCIASGQCEQFGVDAFNCRCEQAFCVRADYVEPYTVFTRGNRTRLVTVRPLQVLEAQAQFLTPQHIDVQLDYGQFDVGAESVVFSVAQPPKHGRISIGAVDPTGVPGIPGNSSNLNTGDQQRFFSLIDLNTDKVRYVHGGDEHFADHMAIDMQLMTAGAVELPDHVDRKHRFVLHVNVTPVNDPPVLSIPPNRILRLTQGIPKVLGGDLLQVNDPDSGADRLMYSVLAPVDSPAQHGSIEVGGKAVAQFSQADVEAGSVTYVIEAQSYEAAAFELALQVSDGIETSPVVYLAVSVMPLQLRMINNTGLVLVHKSSAIITPWNLSFSSNSEEDNVDVKFTIVQAPVFGNIQKLRTVDNSWITVDTFTSDLVQLGNIRYIHNNDFPVHDEFKFIASFSQFNSIKYDFRLTFTKLRIGMQIHNALLINGTRDTTITAQHLSHQTTPLPTFARNIIYTVVQPPKYGQISVTGHGAPAIARASDSFTQQDIDKNLIVYQTHRTSFSSFVDVFEFIVSVAECEDVSSAIKMVYNPPAELVGSLSYQSREELRLLEGDRANLTRLNFQVAFNKFDHLVFSVSTAPKHGRLCQLPLGVGTATAAMTTEDMQTVQSFTLQQLYLNDIFYCHDDTETTADRIDFLVLSDEPTDFQFVCSVLVAIQPVNDNGPTRLSADDAVFHVVRNRTRILSAIELRYTDPDEPVERTSHIRYTKVLASNGDFYVNSGLADTFTQTDIDEGHVLFRHWGDEDNGTAEFQVSDGHFVEPGSLTISAAEPFITIGQRNASIVQEGRHIVLQLTDLAIETNVNAIAEEIEYQVLGDPNYGVLKVQPQPQQPPNHVVGGAAAAVAGTAATSVKNFTQADVRDGRLVYWNTAVASMDRIRYRVSTRGGISAESEILVRIYPSAYWDLLLIRMNQTLYVEESTSVKISRKILEIVHPNISPGDITYLVRTSPQHGYLEIQSITSDDEYNCKVFDQSTINAEKMFYIQAGVNQSSDHFVFDVTNGITWLRGLQLKIVIIPESMYVMTRNITVEEGGAVRLEPADMLPYAEYYQGKILEYKILAQPQYGQLKAGKSKVNRFTFKQLESGQVQYVHDGSENGTDVIRFMAIARNKDSVPFDLWLDVTQVNDEMPHVLTNTGLQTWVGGSTVIRSSDLMAQDFDTPAEQLVFNISHIAGGSLYRRDSTALPSLLNFTQSDINAEQIFFAHDPNQSGGEFQFTVTDGAHETAMQTLRVTTNSVSLQLINNNLLHVFPLTRKQLQSDQLQYRCTDVEREVRFVVTVPPHYGRLVMDDADADEAGTAITTEISEFTQLDIQLGRVLYEHTHAMIELRSNDSFYFDVTSPLASSLIDQMFHIEISVSSGGLLRFLPVPWLHLDEGASAPIHLDLSKVLEYLETRAGIPAPELYIEAYRPEHGKILLYDAPTTEDGTQRVSASGRDNDDGRIMLDMFTAGRVLYQHDHSDTVEDTVHMSVYLMQGQLFLCNLTLPVTVTPVNDHPFVLQTQSPQMSVVAGETRTIARTELRTVDEDTLPADIVYNVISGPTLGALERLSDADGSAQDLAIVFENQFTQADIDANLIQYRHFGAAQPTTFYFRVSDGQFKPAYEIFNLRVLPVQLASGLEREIVAVAQGAQVALIETKHVPVETNAQRTRLVYNVTEPPRFGYIAVDDRSDVMQWSQELLDGRRVSYVQTDMQQSSDGFKINVHIPDSNRSAPAVQFDVKVIVEPFIKINGISITTNDKMRLTSSILLDNPTQTKLNRYNPRITITRRPDHGRIRKIIRTSGTAAVAAALTAAAAEAEDSPQVLQQAQQQPDTDKDITAFTYKELKSGIVFFVARQLPAEVDSINDYFEYTVHMKSVQPGQGFVPIEIHKTPRAVSGSADSTSGVYTPDGSAVNVAAAQPFPFNYAVLVGLVAVVMVLGILMAVLIRCRSARLDKQLHNAGGAAHSKSYPPTLPRPPDFMTLNNGGSRGLYQPTSSSLESGVGGADSLPVTAASTPLPMLSSIPHCKVIPIMDLDDDDDDEDGENEVEGDVDDDEDEDGVGGVGGSDSDDMMDVERQHLHGGLRYPYGDADDWSSSCDVNGGQEVSYASINRAQQMAMQQQQQQQMLLQQKQQRMANPLLRRNQYWV